MIDVWQIAMDELPRDGEPLATTLSREEMTRAERYRFAIDREQFIARRSALRTILGRYLNLPPADVPIATSPEGKPQVVSAAGMTPLHFSIARTRGLALVAVDREHPLGVDCEWRDPAVEFLNVAATAFANDEEHMLQGLDGGALLNAFYRIWTGKEAYAKAIGAGLTEDVRLAVIQDNADDDTGFVAGDQKTGEPCWHLQWREISPDVTLALCTQKTPREFRLLSFTGSSQRGLQVESSE